eukprot:SAG31_NODE_7362_length_1710_cov_0.968963_2_plen_166_part_00
MLALLEANISLNRLQDRASVQELDWNRPPPLAIRRRRWDVIIAADVLYGVPSFRPLLELLETLCRGPRARIVMACGNRQRGARGDLKFLGELRERNVLQLGAGIGRWGGGVVEVMTLRNAAQDDEDDELEDLMRELELEEQQQTASATEVPFMDQDAMHKRAVDK